MVREDGGQFWVNGTRTFHLPRTAYSMNGAGGQYTIIDPENNLVIVRLGHRRGGMSRITHADRSLWAAGCLLVSVKTAFMIMVDYQEHRKNLNTHACVVRRRDRCRAQVSQCRTGLIATRDLFVQPRIG